MPIFGDACLSGARALALTPAPLTGHATATITVPVPQAGRYFVALRVAQGTKVPHTPSRGATLPTGAITFGGMHWDWADAVGTPCAELSVREVTPHPSLRDPGSGGKRRHGCPRSRDPQAHPLKKSAKCGIPARPLPNVGISLTICQNVASLAAGGGRFERL